MCISGFLFPHGNYCLSGTHEDLSFSKGDVLTVVGLEPIHVRAEVKGGGEQVLDVINIPLGHEGTGCKMLPFGSCDSSENTWKVILVSTYQVPEKKARLSAGHW